MRSNVRISLLALAVSALVLLSAGVSTAFAAEGGVEKFFAGNCKEITCGEHAVPPGEAAEATKAFREAGGFVPFGVTDFTLNKFPIGGGKFLPVGFPTENVKNIRIDVAPGVVTSGQAVTRCSLKDFKFSISEAAEPKKGLFLESKCPASSVIGVNEIETANEALEDVKLSGKVYNLEQASGQGTTFGAALPVGGGFFVHTIIKGNVEYNTDYHDYFVINNIPPGLIESRLVLFGAEEPTSKEKFNFIRNPTKCVTVPNETTTRLTAEFARETTTTPYTNLVGTTGCEGLAFAPVFGLGTESTLSDAPDGITTELKAAHPESGAGPDSADLRSATVKLPEGMTMNPSAGAGLQACTPKQAGIAPETNALEIQKLKPIGCPSGAKIGTINLNVPTLPEGALQGPIFLAQNENAKGEAEPITAPPYTIYLDAESSRYGVRVLLKGTLSPNPATGQLTATFNENPQAPFNSVALHFNGGAFAPIANPLLCETGATVTTLVSFASSTPLPGALPFTTEGCVSSPPPFKWAQSTSTLPLAGGANSAFTFNVSRNDGQQYLSQLKTVLPAGLVGKIPVVPLCPEPQAALGTCPASSQIGTTTVTAGAGAGYAFNGNVYLTGPYEGAPYGLSFVVPAVAGPFNLGNVIARSRIEVEPYTGRVVLTDNKVPTIVGGIPDRIKSLNVSITRQGYLLNPTNCGVLATESVLTSTLGATQSLSTPFQAEGCNGLAFKPTFTATTEAKTSKANGASLETTINQPAGGANIKSVLVQLPRQLPSRLTTLQKACPEATFAANPFSCPAGSMVGGARANTPVLPSKMTGPAYLVSHGGAAFPDLDLVLEANGVRVILVGNTDIKKEITTTNFAATPDVPVSSITVNLPTGPHSALAANGNLCPNPLLMPTTITAENGKQIKQNTKIAVLNCPVEVVGRKVVGNTAILTVRTYAGGRISGSGSGLSTVARHLNGATKAASLKVPLSKSGRRRGRPFSVRVRVGFFPKQKGVPSSVAYATVRFG